jgi:phage terminase Nu1 subunit (DNA packaging protein)
MDKHLVSIIKNANFKPAQGFIQFCNQHIDLLREEITRLTAECIVGMTSKTLADKIKKTYKNRYFMIHNK